MLFSSEINILAHRIKRASGLSWRESLHLAINSYQPELLGIQSPTSVWGEWTPQTQRALAGHFWALKLLNAKAGDQGRAHAFGRVANNLFACWENHGRISWADTYRYKGWGDSVRAEILDYYMSAQCNDQTDRMIDLILRTQTPAQQIHMPRWTF